jgi:hypothetical protein
VPEALAIVGDRNDFHPGGALGVPVGHEIAGPPPVRCVAGTPGAELSPALDGTHVDVVIEAIA